MSVFAEEKALARASGRCMGCDGKTKAFVRGGFAVLCGHVECKRYYLQLWHVDRMIERPRRRPNKTMSIARGET